MNGCFVCGLHDVVVCERGARQLHSNKPLLAAHVRTHEHTHTHPAVMFHVATLHRLGRSALLHTCCIAGKHVVRDKQQLQRQHAHTRAAQQPNMLLCIH